MSGVSGVVRLVALLLAVALPLAGLAAAPPTRTVKQHVEDCSANGAALLLDCKCVEKETTRLIAADKSAPWDVVFDRAAVACPSARVKADTATGELRYPQHTFEQRQALRRLALEFVAALDAGSEDDSVARIMATPKMTAAANQMPLYRPQIEQRVRELLARRAARGKLTEHRVSKIGPNYVLVDARAERPVPGVPGEAAHAAQDVVKFAWSASGKPEVADYDFGY